MDDDSTDRPRRKSRPKPGTGRQTKKPRSIPWYRHLSILITTGVCVTFAVLIAGTVVVRKVILTARPPAEHVTTSPNFEPTPTVQPASTATAEPVVATPEEPKDVVVTPTVQPIPAAEKAGTKLAKMLLVGAGKDMFPTISEAIKAAAPGDIIEVRTNGPLLESTAELKLKERIKGVPITIRKGDGFEPVVRSKHALIRTQNVDLVVAGLHFVGASGTSFLWVEEGNVSVSDCSFSCSELGSSSVVRHIGWPDGTERYRMSFERCFLRESRFGSFNTQRCVFDAKNCGTIGMSIGVLIYCELEEQNSVSIDRCTLIPGTVMASNIKDQRQWLAPPFTCRINQSILGHLVVSPTAVMLMPAAAFKPRNAADARLSMDRLLNLEGSNSVRELAVNTNGTPELLESWIRVGDFPFRFPDSPNIPEFDRTLRFGDGLERVRQLERRPGGLPEARLLIRTLLPDQLAVTSTGALAELRESGIAVGCDISQLPVPPPVTQEPFIVPN